MFFYPEGVPVNNQLLLLGICLSMLNMRDNFTNSEVHFIEFSTAKVAIRQVSNLNIAIGLPKSLPSIACKSYLDMLLEGFCFYNGSFEDLRTRAGSDRSAFVNQIRRVAFELTPMIDSFFISPLSIFFPLKYFTVPHNGKRLVLQASQALSLLRFLPNLGSCVIIDGYQLLLSDLPKSISRWVINRAQYAALSKMGENTESHQEVAHLYQAFIPSKAVSTLNWGNMSTAASPSNDSFMVPSMAQSADEVATEAPPPFSRRSSHASISSLHNEVNSEGESGDDETVVAAGADGADGVEENGTDPAEGDQENGGDKGGDKEKEKEKEQEKGIAWLAGNEEESDSPPALHPTMINHSSSHRSEECDYVPTGLYCITLSRVSICILMSLSALNDDNHISRTRSTILPLMTVLERNLQALSPGAGTSLPAASTISAHSQAVNNLLLTYAASSETSSTLSGSSNNVTASLGPTPCVGYDTETGALRLLLGKQLSSSMERVICNLHSELVENPDVSETIWSDGVVSILARRTLGREMFYLLSSFPPPIHALREGSSQGSSGSATSTSAAMAVGALVLEAGHLLD
jgi:hypothetical protein